MKGYPRKYTRQCGFLEKVYPASYANKEVGDGDEVYLYVTDTNNHWTTRIARRFIEIDPETGEKRYRFPLKVGYCENFDYFMFKNIRVGEVLKDTIDRFSHASEVDVRKNEYMECVPRMDSLDENVPVEACMRELRIAQASGSAIVEVPQYPDVMDPFLVPMCAPW